MIPIYRLVAQLMSVNEAASDCGPGQDEDFDDTSKELMQKCAKPAAADPGKGPGKDGVPSQALKSDAQGPAWSTAFKKGTPMSQEKGTGTTPPSTVDGPSKSNPDQFIK